MPADLQARLSLTSPAGICFTQRLNEVPFLLHVVLIQNSHGT